MQVWKYLTCGLLVAMVGSLPAQSKTTPKVTPKAASVDDGIDSARPMANGPLVYSEMMLGLHGSAKDKAMKQWAFEGDFGISAGYDSNINNAPDIVVDSVRQESIGDTVYSFMLKGSADRIYDNLFWHFGVYTLMEGYSGRDDLNWGNAFFVARGSSQLNDDLEVGMAAKVGRNHQTRRLDVAGDLQAEHFSHWSAQGSPFIVQKISDDCWVDASYEYDQEIYKIVSGETNYDSTTHTGVANFHKNFGKIKTNAGVSYKYTGYKRLGSYNSDGTFQSGVERQFADYTGKLGVSYKFDSWMPSLSYSGIARRASHQGYENYDSYIVTGDTMWLFENGSHETHVGLSYENRHFTVRKTQGSSGPKVKYKIWNTYANHHWHLTKQMQLYGDAKFISRTTNRKQVDNTSSADLGYERLQFELGIQYSF